MVNSEFFGVYVQRAECDFSDAIDELIAAAADIGLGNIVTREALDACGVLEGAPFPWYLYDIGQWRDWGELDRGGSARFPLMGFVKQRYNVKGAAAACCVCGALPTLSDSAVTNIFPWCAAAKPFGDEDGRRVIDVMPGAPLVLPSFRFTRLIPLDGVGESNLGTHDPQWVEHVREHVPRGIRVSSCVYCSRLNKWDELGDARHAGYSWLLSHDHDAEDGCKPPTSGGSGPGGGASHGH